MYVCAKRHLEARHGTQPSHAEAILTPHLILMAFLLVTGWVFILLVNIILCLGPGPFGAIITTVVGGIELFVLLFLAIRSSQEIWEGESVDPEGRSHRGDLKLCVPESLRWYTWPNSLLVSSSKPLPIIVRMVYVVSFTLSTVTLVTSVASTAFFAIMLAFVATVPHHINLFLESGKVQLAKVHTSQIRSIALSFLLVALWSFSFLLAIVCDGVMFQKIVVGIFAGFECIVVGYLAVRGVMDNLDVEGQVKLP